MSYIKVKGSRNNPECCRIFRKQINALFLRPETFLAQRFFTPMAIRLLLYCQIIILNRSDTKCMVCINIFLAFRWTSTAEARAIIIAQANRQNAQSTVPQRHRSSFSAVRQSILKRIIRSVASLQQIQYVIQYFSQIPNRLIFMGGERSYLWTRKTKGLLWRSPCL